MANSGVGCSPHDRGATVCHPAVNVLSSGRALWSGKTPLEPRFRSPKPTSRRSTDNEGALRLLSFLLDCNHVHKVLSRRYLPSNIPAWGESQMVGVQCCRGGLFLLDQLHICDHLHLCSSRSRLGLHYQRCSLLRCPQLFLRGGWFQHRNGFAALRSANVNILGIEHAEISKNNSLHAIRHWIFVGFQPTTQLGALLMPFSACIASTLRLTQLHNLGGFDITYMAVGSLNWSVIGR
jgi:hypothetical protein